MKRRHAAILLLILLALAMGGCKTQPPIPPAVDAEFTLQTAMVEGKMVFVGASGGVDGAVNPDLIVSAGDVIRVVLVNGDGMPHDFAVPVLGAQTSLLTTKGQSAEVIFEVNEIGEFDYYCTVSGHRQMGMEGKLIVGEPQVGYTR